jgi:hypothetical protein
MPRPGKSSYSDEKPPCLLNKFFPKIFKFISYVDSYIALTAMAIQQSPEKMLPLSDIYKVKTKKLFFF